EVTLIEGQDQVMPPLDPEMVVAVHQRLQEQGVRLELNNLVTGFSAQDSDRLTVSTKLGTNYEADLVILGMGVRPETTLAQAAGLKLGDRGGIQVNPQMQTSDPKIWAVGDAVEVPNFITQDSELLALAGPANRQGRIAADAIFGRESQFRGVQGTSVCGMFDLTIASTGVNEKTLQKLGWQYNKVYLHPGHHVGYYPNAKAISIKLLYSTVDGQILGAQAVGEAGVEKRIDVIATAIQMKATVFDLEEAELCYAPQFGAAKDPVNMAGMIAANALRGDAPLVHWTKLGNINGELLLDVRESHEFEAERVLNAVNIPLSQLRQRMQELPKDKPLWVSCRVGQRAYYATRALRLDGFEAYNLSGGFKTYEAINSLKPTKIAVTL
ncbi:MAG: FAD-dependent oxidoreductase, partial [Waterburya sp.]